MKRTLVALLAPPAALVHYGAAAHTAAPIGVFWLASLAAIAYGLADSSAGLLLGGVLLWLAATVWARLVIRGVESDLLHGPDSTHDHQVEARLDDPDPISETRNPR